MFMANKSVVKKPVSRRADASERAAIQRASQKVKPMPLWLKMTIGIILLVPIIFFAVSYVQQQTTIQADKDKFAKIETLVNDVTADLKKTYPDKDWQIVKY